MSLTIDGTNGFVMPGGQTQLGALTQGTAAASTSGTSVDFTSIPSWVRRITISLSGVSTSGTSTMISRIGDSTGFYTTGYTGSVATLTNAAAVAVAATTGSLNISMVTAASDNCVATVVWTLVVGNTWVGTSSARTNGTVFTMANSSVTMTGALDRVRVTTGNGTDTFDAGSINILYE